MRVRFLASLGTPTIVIAAMTLAPASVVGQTSAATKSKKTVTAKTWTPPLTPEGQRRLAAAAATSFTVPFQPGIDPETEQQQAAAAAASRRLPDGPEDVSNDRRCITFGVPRVGGNYGAGVFGYYQILQAPGNVVLTSEFIHEARIIPLDGRRHLPPS